MRTRRGSQTAPIRELPPNRPFAGLVASIAPVYLEFDCVVTFAEVIDAPDEQLSGADFSVRYVQQRRQGDPPVRTSFQRAGTRQRQPYLNGNVRFLSKVTTAAEAVRCSPQWQHSLVLFHLTLAINVPLTIGSKTRSKYRRHCPALRRYLNTTLKSLFPQPPPRLVSTINSVVSYRPASPESRRRCHPCSSMAIKHAS